MSIIQDAIEKRTIQSFLDSGVFERMLEEERELAEKLRQIREEEEKNNHRPVV